MRPASHVGRHSLNRPVPDTNSAVERLPCNYDIETRLHGAYHRLESRDFSRTLSMRGDRALWHVPGRDRPEGNCYDRERDCRYWDTSRWACGYSFSVFASSQMGCDCGWQKVIFAHFAIEMACGVGRAQRLWCAWCPLRGFDERFGAVPDEVCAEVDGTQGFATEVAVPGLYGERGGLEAGSSGLDGPGCGG